MLLSWVSWSASKLFLSKEEQATQILVITISKNQALLCQININTYAFKEESLFKNADSFHDYFYHSPEIRSWSVFGLYKTRGPELVGGRGGGVQMSGFLSIVS